MRHYATWQVEKKSEAMLDDGFQSVTSPVQIQLKPVIELV